MIFVEAHDVRRRLTSAAKKSDGMGGRGGLFNVGVIIGGQSFQALRRKQ